MVHVTEIFRRLIVENASNAQLKAQAIRDGMQPLRYDGWKKIKQGMTSIEEVLRVTMEDDAGVTEELLNAVKEREAKQ